MVTEDLTLGDEHTIQYTDEALQNSTPETYIISLVSNKFNKNKIN